VAKDWKDRKIQQALLQPHKPEHKKILMEYRQSQHRDRARGAKPAQGKIPLHPALPRGQGPLSQAAEKLGGKPGLMHSKVSGKVLGKKLLLDQR